jgi:hypothetical protein
MAAERDVLNQMAAERDVLNQMAAERDVEKRRLSNQMAAECDVEWRRLSAKMSDFQAGWGDLVASWTAHQVSVSVHSEKAHVSPCPLSDRS